MGRRAWYINLDEYLRDHRDLRLKEVSGTLCVTKVPSEHPGGFWFWAVQFSFFDARDTEIGWAHLGFQWHAKARKYRAACWGGKPKHTRAERFLPGTTSPFAPGDRHAKPGDQENTREFCWMRNRKYRLTIQRVQGTRASKWEWAGKITDLSCGETSEIRRLFVEAEYMRCVVYWSEDAVECGKSRYRECGQEVAAEWSDFDWISTQGNVIHPDRVMATYQKKDCQTDDTSVNDAGTAFVQAANVPRRTAHQTRFRLQGGRWSPEASVEE